jgi:DNA-directed RNA polymerase specialized sigma24 family protein
MSYEEIGRSLSCSVSAVKSRLHRTRQTLAQRSMLHPPAPVPAGERYE